MVHWLYEYAHRGPVSNEDYFDEEDKNRENASLLSYFYEYVRKVSIRQRVMEVYLTKEEFPTYEYIIRIKDRYFRVQLIVGQGTMTWVQECEKPDFSYVVISEKEEELYEDWCDWSPAE